MGQTKTTFLKVKNNTSSNITTSVRDIDSFDWGSNHRPDKNFNNKVIKPHRELISPEDINALATANLFTLDLIFDDKTTITFRIDQGCASGRKNHFIGYVPAESRANNLLVAAGDAGDAIFSSFQHRERNILGGNGGSNGKYTASINVIGNTIEIDVH